MISISSLNITEKKMNILVSAYACEPNKGSEPGVGWNWVIELSKRHKVWVLTKANNKETIEKYKRENSFALQNVQFIYVNVNKKLTFWKKGNRGIRFYYYMWQIKAYQIAKRLNRKIDFDYLHCLTFVSFTQPSFLYKLNLPIVWNVAGGENIPQCINLKMSCFEHISKAARKLSQVAALHTTWNRKMMQKSAVILATTEETKNTIPKRYRDKTIVFPSIGIEDNNLPNLIHKSQIKVDRKFKVVMAGRLIYWKGFEIGVKAFLNALQTNPDMELYILGDGNRKKNIVEICGEELGKRIFFAKKIEHDEIYHYFLNFDVFLNTSLQDSGCMVILEAMAVALPVICIDLGGPAAITTKESAIKVQAADLEKMIHNISQSIITLSKDENIRSRLGNNGYQKILQEWVYSHRVEEFEKILKS
jgi:glycosyltransferase involved in cell wall biosynthesis